MTLVLCQSFLVKCWKTRTRDPHHNKGQLFPNHMIHVTCDCNMFSIKEFLSKKIMVFYVCTCAHNHLPLLKHFNVVVTNLKYIALSWTLISTPQIIYAHYNCIGNSHPNGDYDSPKLLLEVSELKLKSKKLS